MADLTLDEEIRQEFLAESKEGIERLERDLVVLEDKPDDPELLGSIFRVVHTIKGTSGFLGFSRLERVAHVGETLLANLRDGSLRMNESIASALLAMVDALRGFIANVEHTASDGEDGHPALLALLEDLARDSAPSAANDPAPPWVEDLTPAPLATVATRAAAPASPNTARPQGSPPVPGHRPEHPSNLDDGPDHNRTKTAAPAPAPTSVSSESSVAEGLRVDIGLVDSLINLAGELVLVRNEVLQSSAANGDPAFLDLSRRLNVITADLQERIMRMRMQPIQTLFSKFPRLVRDLAKTCGKEVRVELEGRSTELDRTLIEAIKDPLMHILRNAVDHGIEGPAERLARGKPAEGTITFRAYHTGGVVHIEVEDDGGGVPIDKVRRKAIERGLLSPADGATKRDPEILRLIFLPGFSTADKITNVSGRGVGMDVVKTNVEKIGGLVELTSLEGVGSTFRLKIPLTLAIVPGVIAHCRNRRFAIPQVSLLEFVRVEDAARVEYIHDAAVYRLRGRLLPLVFLDRALGYDAESRTPEPVVAGAEKDEDEGAEEGTGQGSGFHIAVLSTNAGPYGLVVDKLGDTQEIVVKALAPLLQNSRLYSGATILGDGSVALILDVDGIAMAAQLGASVTPEAGAAARASESSAPTSQGERERELLLVQLSGGGRAGIPLPWVDRIENVPRDSMERSGDQDVIQVRDEIVPLIDLVETLPERRSRPRQPPAEDHDPTTLCLIVARSRTTSAAIIVEKVLDVVVVSPFLKRIGCRAGVEGTAIIDGRVTEVLDMSVVLQLAGIQEPPVFASLQAIA